VMLQNLIIGCMVAVMNLKQYPDEITDAWQKVFSNIMRHDESFAQWSLQATGKQDDAMIRLLNALRDSLKKDVQAEEAATKTAE
jgi:non-homologous end joining protein Ku